MNSHSQPIADHQRVLTPTERRELHQAFERGCQALTEASASAAAECLARCIQADPGNVLYVATFIECLKHRLEPASLGKRFSLMRHEWQFRKASRAGAWDTVLQLGPTLLVHRPHDPFLLSQMAAGCRELRYREVELAWLRWALRANPDDVDLLRQTARSLARKGRFDESVAIWQQLLDHLPEDLEASRAVQDWLEVPADSAFYGSDLPTGDAKRPSAERLQSLRGDVARDAANPQRYLALGNELLRLGRLDEAERTLRQAVSVSPGYFPATERLAQIHLEQIRRQLRFAQELALADAHPEIGELVDGLRGELARRELESADTRSQRHPEDDRLSLEAAQLLRRAGNAREALRRVEKISEVSPHYPESLLIGGECFQALRQFERALAGYRQAEAAAKAAGNESVAEKARERAQVLESFQGS